MLGLGDNFYQRCVIRQVPGRHQLVTAWPQLYAGLSVECVRPRTGLRTQSKNVARDDLPWVSRPMGMPRRVHYVGQPGTMLEGLCTAFRVRHESMVFDGPPVKPRKDGKYIVVRPATVRTEWRADARNPMPEYLSRAVDALRSEYRIVSVADLQDGQEWAVGDLPYADQRYHRGEMQIEELLSLVAGAAGVIGGVGWLAPAAVAYQVPMLLVFGGWGLHNGPQRIFDRRMDTSRIEQAIPDRFCMCGSASHHCDKTISRIDDHIERFALRLAQG